MIATSVQAATAGWLPLACPFTPCASCLAASPPALQDQHRISGALYVLRFLARKYEFRDEEERAPLEGVVNAAFPPLLGIFQARLDSLLLACSLGSLCTAPPLTLQRCGWRPVAECVPLMSSACPQMLLAMDSSAPELAELLKLVCKTFW